MEIGVERSPADSRSDMASSLKYNDFFAVLDMLGEDGMDLGDDLPDEANATKPTTTTAVIRKHPVGCRQRNVARRRVCPSVDMDLSQVRDPEIRASLSSFRPGSVVPNPVGIEPRSPSDNRVSTRRGLIPVQI
jgi:hypothetical protein